MYPSQERYWQNVQQYMQYANLNSGAPIFEIRILAQFVCHELFEIAPFHTKNVFILKAKLILNTKVLEWTLHLH